MKSMPRMNNPQFPIYIPTKGRADSRLTIKALQSMGVEFTAVVEEQEFADYASVIPKKNILVLDKAYQRDYDTCDDLGSTRSKGPGPARNFIWDHSISLGFDWHWTMDDNIRSFRRYNKNNALICRDGHIFRAMEDFCLRYKNIAMAGPQYVMFVNERASHKPFTVNTRIYSCNLIRNDVPFRWRGRYNEDTILSLDMLKKKWCTVQFNAFLQDKMTTQTVKGGNTEEFYAKEGTVAKSTMQKRVHPDVSKLVIRFNRAHHHVDYRKFRKENILLLKDNVTIPDRVNNYGSKVKTIRK